MTEQLPDDNNPLISVIIPTYNYASFITRAISSCLKQTYKNIEIIVVNDGSTDNTAEALKEFSSHIRYIYQENRGVSAARNKGMTYAQGDYITFVDADDYLTEDSLEIKLNIFHTHPDIGIVVSDKYTTVDYDKSLRYNPGLKKDKISNTFYKDLLLKKLPFSTSAAIMKASIAKKFTFPENITNGEDIAYFTKIFFSTRAYYLAKPTMVMVKHPDSLRHDIEKIKKQDTELVHTIFDDPLYKGQIKHLYKRFKAERYLSLSRSCYIEGEYTLARQYYLKGITIKPLYLFKTNYLSKFIRALLKTRNKGQSLP